MDTHYSYDDCLELLGGFGRFQWFSTISLILSFMTGGQIIYGITFLTTLPEYECSNYYTGYSTWKWESCTRDDVCSLDNAPEKWRINYDSEKSIKNWADPS